MISLRRVAVHNLKDIDLDLPLGKLIVFCGRSGSGKSSLAIDTLYAEGQRRYIETFSPAARQFLEKIDKPKAEKLDGIPPAIAVTSQNRKENDLTVSETAGIFDYLALLFAQAGHIFCPQCSRPILADTPHSVFQTLKGSIKPGDKLQIAFAPVLEPNPKDFAELWIEQGFLRAWSNGKTLRLDEPIPLEWYQEGLLLIADRLAFDPAEEERLIESLESAFQFGSGKCAVLLDSTNLDSVNLDSTKLSFSRTLSCEYCNVHVPSLSAKLFRTDWIEHIHFASDITSPTLRDLEHCTVTELIRFFERDGRRQTDLRRQTADGRRQPDASVVFDGADNAAAAQPLTLLPSAVCRLPSILTRLHFLQKAGLDYLTLSRRMDTLSTGEQRRVMLTSALGSSLADMLYILDEPSLGLHRKDTAKLLEAILELRDRGNTVILVEHDKQLLQHADHIVEIGPGAGEEGGNIIFQGSVSEMLVDAKSLTAKYLNAVDSRRQTADGRRQPDASVSQNTAEPQPADCDSMAAQPPTLLPSAVCRLPSINLTGCTGNNLKNLTAVFPLNGLCVVTGVSGAGKSSLVRQTLYPALCKHFGKKTLPGLPFEQVQVPPTIHDVVMIDQTPMGRNSSSNPATYLKIFDDIRGVFAATNDAKAKRITARHFSFNVAGGRCEHCKGEGNLTINMQFLPDQVVLCPECKGRRYQQSVLDVLYRGKSIAEVLNMSAREAFGFFRGQAKLQHKLRLLFEAGLDYIRLGQSSCTLSGGESQRLRLAGYLGQISGSRSLILMDEPTAGLHFADVEQMLSCFRSLITSGHSLIVIEHNEMVIEVADWQLELDEGEIG